MKFRNCIAAAALTAAAALSAAGCGAGWNAAHNHNAPTPVNDSVSRGDWHWINSPGNFQTLIYRCIKTEGYYETQDNQYPIVIVPQDPLCGYKGPVYLRPAR